MHRKQILILSILAVLLSGAIFVWARPVYAPGYADMTDKSDLVVIATPIARKELPGATVVPGVAQGTADGKSGPIPAVEVETTFHAVVILRGNLDDKDQHFTLLHLKESNPSSGGVINGLDLVDFNPDSGDQYLMFLKRSADGRRYEAMNGQTDPGFSIEKLQQRLYNGPPAAIESKPKPNQAVGVP